MSGWGVAAKTFAERAEAADPSTCPQCGSPKPSVYAYCSDKCEIAALRSRMEGMRVAVSNYFSHYGANHIDDCPEDDTCSCPLVVAIVKAFWDRTRP